MVRLSDFSMIRTVIRVLLNSRFVVCRTKSEEPILIALINEAENIIADIHKALKRKMNEAKDVLLIISGKETYRMAETGSPQCSA